MEQKDSLTKIRFSKMILSTKKLKNEVLVAFGLIILTLLVPVAYLFPGVASFFQDQGNLPIVMIISLIIIFFSFMIIIQIVEPIIKISSEAKKIARGELTTKIQLMREDELGDLGNALNKMTVRIRENVEELKKLSQTTQELNTEINNRIAMLSHLMEISNMISQYTPLSEVLNTAVKKSLITHEMILGCVVLKDRTTNEYKIECLCGPKSAVLIQRNIEKMKIQLGHGLLGRTILKQEQTIVDQNSLLSRELEDFRSQFLVKNAIITPISSKGSAYGLLIVGNDADQMLSVDSKKEFFQLVAKHIAIAVLNDILKREIEKLEATDSLTGLFNNTYARNKLNVEIKKAVNFQRSCSFVLMHIGQFGRFKEAYGHIRAEDVLIKIATLLKGKLSEEDRAARFAEDEFALILPNKNKKDSIKLADQILKEIQQKYFVPDASMNQLTITAAVVENPIDGDTADELILKSGIIINDTMEQGGNRVGYQV